MHWQWLIVHVCGYAKLCHLDDELIAPFETNSGNTANIQMARRLMVHCEMVKRLNSKGEQGSVITLNNILASRKHAVVTVELYQTQSCLHIRHIALIPWANNVIFPSTKFCLSKGILALAMKTQELRLFIHGLGVYAGNGTPGKATALGGGQVLDGMETE